jgi:hydroxypyruvate reductase/glycerate 2-kinase
MESISDKHSRILSHHKATLRQVVSALDNLSLKLEVAELPDQLYLLAIGKGSQKLLEAFTRAYKGEIVDGIILSPEPISLESKDQRLKNLTFLTGSHPLPSLENEASTLEILCFIDALPAGASLVCLISGGTSSLLCLPPDSIAIEDLQRTYQILLQSGASIDQMNTVRKHLSLVKGGNLAQKAHHLRLHSYLLSDVPNDIAEVIGSGPMIADSSTFSDALQVVNEYQLSQDLPNTVLDYLEQGTQGLHPETPKPGLNDHPNQNIHLMTGSSSIQPFLSTLLEQQGFGVHWASEPIQASVKKETQRIAAEVISVLNGQSNISSKTPQALVYHGESYAQVTGLGKGGRNQELALLLALSLEGQHPVTILTLATDGVDGPTDAAGAIVSSYTTLHARKQKTLPEPYIQQNDSYHFHERMNTLIRTGPTGNNLMDLCVVLIS